jgi:hypothetical protein
MLLLTTRPDSFSRNWVIAFIEENTASIALHHTIPAIQWLDTWPTFLCYGFVILVSHNGSVEQPGNKQRVKPEARTTSDDPRCVFHSLHKSLETAKTYIWKFEILLIDNWKIQLHYIYWTKAIWALKRQIYAVQFRYLISVGTMWNSAESSSYCCAQVKIFMRSVYTKPRVCTREK